MRERRFCDEPPKGRHEPCKSNFPDSIGQQQLSSVRIRIRNDDFREILPGRAGSEANGLSEGTAAERLHFPATWFIMLLKYPAV